MKGPICVQRLLVVGILSFVVAPAMAKDDRPNVLMILVDDLGYGDLSCYGAQDLQTPHIDRLIKQGMRWTQF